jgi:hypothetical protein
MDRSLVRGALYTAFPLLGGMALGILTGAFAFERLPGHMSELSRSSLAAIPALVGAGVGGFIWGRLMGRLAGETWRGRMTWAGALSFGPSVILAAIGLSALEVAIVERGGGPPMPIHNVFTLLFVPSAFLVAGIGGLAMGIAVKEVRRSIGLGLRVGLAAGLAFLAVNRGMDALGWRVGAPGAAERATMVTVLALGSLGAALAGGAVLGSALGRRR